MWVAFEPTFFWQFAQLAQQKTPQRSRFFPMRTHGICYRRLEDPDSAWFRYQVPGFHSIEGFEQFEVQQITFF